MLADRERGPEGIRLLTRKQFPPREPSTRLRGGARRRGPLGRRGRTSLSIARALLEPTHRARASCVRRETDAGTPLGAWAHLLATGWKSADLAHPKLASPRQGMRLLTWGDRKTSGRRACRE